ncbi:hypothetical protein OESDEN_25228 [Oesophagostomum dentatum]|uniref:Uncharacterized protein n=1 Tax=Oesophagostomum dentatum TaxID=61180 RepID=A0A0B1RU65_OESDE|nr:hypothetical protein OESDEN_25228 [Oesophagostomum dentatum]
MISEAAHQILHEEFQGIEEAGDSKGFKQISSMVIDETSGKTDKQKETLPIGRSFIAQMVSDPSYNDPMSPRYTVTDNRNMNQGRCPGEVQTSEH